MPELLALSAAVVFGLVHFFSGLLARWADSYGVAVVGQVGGTILVLAAALVAAAGNAQSPVLAAPDVTGAALGWGALSGVGTGIGVAYLYRGLAAGQMSVVVPLSDVAAVAVPVLVGVVVLHERPGLLPWLGVGAALPALWLVSRQRRPGNGSAPASGAGYGMVAGVGFALQFLAISRIDPAAGLWPILAARLAATLTIVPTARARATSRAGLSLRSPR